MEKFSGLKHTFDKFKETENLRKMIETVTPFPKSEMTKKMRMERREASKDFWKFDKIYFPPDAYSGGYSKPAAFHKKLFKHTNEPGVHIELGSRKMGKTATLKKAFVWHVLQGHFTLAATLSSTLPTSRNILEDIRMLLDSERIRNDFEPDFSESNADQFTVRIPGIKGFTRVIALSGGRSARGATFGFNRVKYILVDDLETRESSLGEDQVIERINFLREAFQSLETNGTMTVLGNNFDERCALNRLKIEFENNLLPARWKVYVYPAWNRGFPLWRNRYPAKSEDELRKTLDVSDMGEWLGDFQQKPSPPDGLIFKRNNLQFYDKLPKDARGVVYCDPNLAKKGRGDSTAIVSMLYSVKTEKYYVTHYRCRSFADSNILLDAVLDVYNIRHRALGFDGNVSQESTWTNNIRNYCRIKQTPFPYVEYYKFKVDDLAKNIQSVFSENRVLFNPDYKDTEEAERFFGQLFAFSGKRANKKDDAPDALISAFEMLHLRRLVKRKGVQLVTVINDFDF